MASNPPLHMSRFPTINTSITSEFNEIRFSLDTPTTATSSNPSPHNGDPPPSLSGSWTQSPLKPKPISRARNESRKLFAHVLDQLVRRPMPPSVFDAFANVEDESVDNRLGLIVGTVKDVVKLRSKVRDKKPATQAGPTADDDSDDDPDRIYSTDGTYDLMVQLKDVLIMSISQGWHIFDESSSLEKGGRMGKHTSAFRRSRNSLQPGGKRSRSPSPAHAKQVQAPELLALCISVLSSVILEDCRYKISSPRPSRPPNALQALTLDIAQFLVHSHQHDSRIISQIGFAMIPAFTTFQPEMHVRLLTFFEGIMRGILHDLTQVQGLHDFPPNDQYEETAKLGANVMEGSPIVSIHVDEVHDNSLLSTSTNKWVPWSPMSSSGGLVSSSPLQPLPLQYMSSLVAPLLATILESIDFSQSDTHDEVLHRFYRLFHLLVNTKFDTYMDVLQVMGYHTPKARHFAANLLLTFWPKAVGHPVVSRPFPKYAHHPYTHQFIPWRFISKSIRPGFYGLSHHDCRACSDPVHEFGLLCPFCMCAVHFDCYDYPEGCHIVQYALPADENVQRVAMFRFSNIISDLNNVELGRQRSDNHVFRSVNIFTLSLCFVCHMPLWGSVLQGLNCTLCMHFIHSTCLSHLLELPPCSGIKSTSGHMSIDWADLRRSCVDFYCDILQLSDAELGQLTFEEISVYYAYMWIQLQLVTRGIALGSIVVTHYGENAVRAQGHTIDEFELHRIVRWCEAHLASNRLACSDAMDDYLHENRFARSEHLMMFDWSNLIYILTVTKLPLTSKPMSHSFSSDLLNVNHPDAFISYPSDAPSQSFEVVTLSHIRDVLGYEFHIYSDAAAKLLLSHLNHLGFFERLDHSTSLFGDGNVAAVHCTFPLPLGFDLSTNVETLFSAVEAGLSDLDLSVNEVSFLLLVRRLWPNGVTSDYALRRLTQNIVSWILAEDDNLAIMLRDYLAKQRSLPGVRSNHENAPWPSTQNFRPTPSSSVNNGGDYVAARRILLSRYAIPWLLALHDQDPAIYARLLYDICSDIEDNVTVAHADILAQPMAETKEQLANHRDKVLWSINRLCQSSLAFTVFDDLFTLWLESLSSLKIHDERIPSLSRIFPRETEGSHNFSTTFESPEIQPEDTYTVDPWRTVIHIGSETREGLSRSLDWLCTFARSGVEVPLSIFMQFSALVTKYDGSLTDSYLLVKAILSSTWLKSIGRQDLQLVFSELHARLAPSIVKSISSRIKTQDCVQFIRASLGTCLLLYGCDRGKIMELKMVLESDVKGLPSRRKLNTRGSIAVDPMIVDPRLIDALERYIASDDNEISNLIAKFLNLFLTDSPYLEPYEVDNFILRNGHFLATCGWHFYNIQHPEISSLRTAFLLRTLVVDSQPFQDVVSDHFTSSNWERRLLSVTRLFRVILDVTSPSFTLEGRQWRSSVNDIFYHFFAAIWTDEKEEVCEAANTFASTLLPAHFDAITMCWNEFLARAPIAEREKLVAFLLQLRPHFPAWKVLSWDAIIDALSEDDFTRKVGENEDGAAKELAPREFSSTDNAYSGHTSADPDVATLRVSILLLSLQMIADGITIDSFSLLKIKAQLVQVAGFNDISLVPSQSGHSFHVRFGEVRELPELAFPCVSGLLRVFDAYQHVDLAPSAMAGSHDQDERPSPHLVGSIFVDAFLAMFCTIGDPSSLPVLTFKCMLETLCVIIYKHDFESRALRHLQQTLRRAVIRALDILSEDISYELRQLALSATQAFIKRWHNFMGSIVYTSIETVAKLIASQHHNGPDALAVQAKSFIETTLTVYAQNGLFTNLLKRRLDRDFFVVLKQITDAGVKHDSTSPESLRESLLRDALTRAVDVDHTAFQTVLQNIQNFVEVVFHHGYSAELLTFVGQQLTHLARRMSDWAPDTVDPGPLLLIVATLIQHNKSHSRDLLSYVDTVMRVVLNRLFVNTTSLSRLIQATATLFRKSPHKDSIASVNGVIPLILEILADGLRMKSRVFPATIRSMLEAVMTTDIPGSPPPIIRHLPSLLALVDPGLYFLQSHVWLDVGSETDFTACLIVGKMIMQVAGKDPSVVKRLSDYGAEKSAHTNLSVRAWNILALTALLEPTESWHSIIFAQLSSFSYAYHALLRAYTRSTVPPESSTIDINYAYIGIKLWIMLAHKVSIGNNDGDRTTFIVWSELWPPFQSLIEALEIDARAGLPMTLATLVTSSVADLFIFLRSLHTPITLYTSTHIATMDRLRNLGQGEIYSAKLARALRSMSEPPPNVSFDVLVNQVAKDIVAAEKLKLVETKVNQEKRSVPERYRNARVAS